MNQIDTNIEQNIRDLRIYAASHKKGCFIPYVGKDYGKNHSTNGSSHPLDAVRILIIGPRHFCDGRDSHRNRDALLNHQKDENGQTLKSDNMDEYGCIIRTYPQSKECIEFSNCLRKYPNRCPVYYKKDCPLESKCEKDKTDKKILVKCNGHRSLKCETLFAIHGYLKYPGDRFIPDLYSDKFYIKSENVGTRYFNDITEYVMRRFGNAKSGKELSENPTTHDKRDVWDRVAFINFVQDYLPYNGIGPDELKELIKRRIKSEYHDMEYCQEVIDKLNPDYIILTDGCLKDVLKKKLKEQNFSECEPDTNFKFHLYKRLPIDDRDEVPSKKRLRLLKEYITEEYDLNESHAVAAKEIYNIVEAFSSDEILRHFGINEHSRDKRKEIQEEIYRLLEDIIKNGDAPTPTQAWMIPRYYSDFSKEGREKQLERFKDWIRKSNGKKYKGDDLKKDIKPTVAEIIQLIISPKKV